jgi:uncharacterized protein YcbK (DUF882 family)
MLRLSLMVLTILVGTQAAGAEKSTPGKATSSTTQKAVKAAGLTKSEKRMAKRQGKRVGKMIGWPVPEQDLLAESPLKPSGNVYVYSLNYKTEAKVNIYNSDGSFNIEALAEINHIFKCRRSGLEHEIDTRLVTILSHLYDRFEGKRIEILSGYRFQRRTTSNHFHGTAADIRIVGVDPRVIRGFLHTIDSGGMGVGWYPVVGFVHVDIRKPPSYRWIDYSKSNPDARDRQPPRGFKRKDPES